jgi:hypothetical protein
MHRLLRKPAPPGGAGGGGGGLPQPHLAHLEAADWKHLRRWRLLAVDRGVVTFADLYYSPAASGGLRRPAHLAQPMPAPCAPACAMCPCATRHGGDGRDGGDGGGCEPAPPSNPPPLPPPPPLRAGALPFTITGEEGGRRVGAHLVHITSPADARYQPLTRAAAAAPGSATIRALVIPLGGGAGGAAAGAPRVLARWRCSGRGSTGQLEGSAPMARSAADARVYEVDAGADASLARWAAGLQRAVWRCAAWRRAGLAQLQLRQQRQLQGGSRAAVPCALQVQRNCAALCGGAASKW